MPKHNITPDEPVKAKVEDFDIDSWLSGTTRLTQSVTVYGKPHLRDEIARLDERLKTESVEAFDQRMGSKNPAVEIAREIEAKRAEMTASGKRFTFRGLSQKQRDKITAVMGDRDDDDEFGLRTIAEMCVEPAGMDWEKFRLLRDGDDEAGFAGIGVEYFESTITRTVQAVRAGHDVDVPFSWNASHTLSIQE